MLILGILTDISPLAEYFIKSNSKLWQLVDYVTNLIEAKDEDEDEEKKIYTFANPDSFDNIQRNLGKIDTLITEMTVLKLPRLLKDFNKLSPNEYKILFVPNVTPDGEGSETFGNFSDVNQRFQDVNIEFDGLVKTDEITQGSVNILQNYFQQITDSYETIYNRLKSKAMNYNLRRTVGSGYNEQFNYLKHIRKRF